MHLHGMWMELENGQGERIPRVHTVNVQPAERLSLLVPADAPGPWAFHCHVLYHWRPGCSAWCRYPRPMPPGRTPTPPGGTLAAAGGRAPWATERGGGLTARRAARRLAALALLAAAAPARAQVMDSALHGLALVERLEVAPGRDGDWASRPWGQNSFARKPSAVIGASIGSIGTAVAQQSLRAVLSFCNAPQMNSPEAYIHFKPGLITPEGEVTEPSTKEFLQNYMKEFQAFITRVLTVLPRTAG